jgi:PKD repeat protein
MNSPPSRTLLLTIVLVVLGAAPASAGTRWDGTVGDDHLIVGASRTSPGTSGSVASGSGSGSTIVTNCVPMENNQLRCYSYDPAAPVSAGIMAVTVDAATGPSPAAIAASAATQFRRLPLTSGGIVIQPSRGWTLVNVDTIVLTDPTPAVFDTTILGIPVTVRATPTRYSWSFGDDTPPLVTTEPGAEWPDPTVTHAYRTAGTRTITLTTQWSGEFRIAGSPTWQPIAGVATTAESAPPLEVRSATNVLVTNP